MVFSQAAHQIDIARLLGGGLVETVYAATGSYDPARPTEGAYTAILKFAGGAVATLTYSGYGRFDSDEFTGWRGESGPAGASLPDAAPADRQHEHFGLFVVSCERGDIRPMPDGVRVYADDARRQISLPAPSVPRTEVIDELYAAVIDGVPPLHSGEWGRATLEVCRAVIASAQGGGEVRLAHQVATGDVSGGKAG